MYVKDTVLSRTLQCESHEHLSSNDFPCPCLQDPHSVSHHSSAECELLQLPGYLTPGLLDFEFGNSPIHSSPDHHFCTSRKLFVFFPFFSIVPNSLFKKKKLAKRILLSASDCHENFFLNRCGIKYYTIFRGHIGDGHREIQEIGAHRLYLQTLAG
jgi:hypothetical protein